MKDCTIKFVYEPRDFQIIVLLCFLFKDMDNGLIEKI